jgi:leucyl aminopeptidase (aminopeptidase T)
VQALETSRAARALVSGQFCVQPGETVVVTADTARDPSAVEAVLGAAAGAGAKTLLMTIPQLPYQGKLADPYIPEALSSAVAASDVWFDMTFPYMAGSSTHDRAMKAGRARYLLLGDVNAAALQRLYGTVDLDILFHVQAQLDDLVARHQGASCRVTAPSGTDITFRLGKPAGKKQRHANTPGTSTVMGSCIFYPETESVRGVIALDAIFHEYYCVIPTPIRLTVDGDIREIAHIKDHAIVTERSLRRAGNGKYGRVIHLTCGFHPAARFSGASFIEDIRACGANAIGLGVPWWEPGGGENHPDGVVTGQSLWVDGGEVMKDGRIIGPAELARAARALEQAAHSGSF